LVGKAPIALWLSTKRPQPHWAPMSFVVSMDFLKRMYLALIVSSSKMSYQQGTKTKSNRPQRQLHLRPLQMASSIAVNRNPRQRPRIRDDRGRRNDFPTTLNKAAESRMPARFFEPI
jgi:hypothetical protein